MNEDVRSLKEGLADGSFMEMIADCSTMLWCKFDNLQRAGFTEEQALEIVVRQGIGWSASSGGEE